MPNDSTYDADALFARVSSTPRTPSERARRLVYRYQGTQKAVLWIGVGFLAIGLILSTVFCWGLPVDLAIALSGVHAAGTVTSTHVDKTMTVNNQHPTVVEFAFEVNERVVEGRIRTIDDALAALQPQAAVDVEYARGLPSWSRLNGTTRNLFGYVGLIALLFPTIGALLVFFAVRSNRREIRAFSHGVPALATVIFRGFDTSTTINGRHPYKMEWEFSVDDKIHAGSISVMNALEFEDMRRSEKVVIVHDATDPEINTLYVE